MAAIFQTTFSNAFSWMKIDIWISIKFSLKFVPKGPIDNIPASVQLMAWRRPGDKPLSEQMMVVLPTHMCVTRPQWVTMLFDEQLAGHWIYYPAWGLDFENNFHVKIYAYVSLNGLIWVIFDLENEVWLASQILVKFKWAHWLAHKYIKIH